MQESKPLEAEIGNQIEASTDISESCAAEIANASEVPISSASIEKEEDLSERDIDGSTARMQAAVGDGIESIDNSETTQKDQVEQEENAQKD